MTKPKTYALLLVVFLLILFIATVYSYTSWRANLPLVTLLCPQPLAENRYQIPHSAVYFDDDTKQVGHLFVVRQTKGAWGTEYNCIQTQAIVISTDDKYLTVVANLKGLPVALHSSALLVSGQAVRLS